MQYNISKTAIPRKWKNLLKKGNNSTEDHIYYHTRYCNSVGINKVIYNKLNTNDVQIRALDTIWKTNLQDPSIEITEQFKRIYLVTN